MQDYVKALIDLKDAAMRMLSAAALVDTSLEQKSFAQIATELEQQWPDDQSLRVPRNELIELLRHLDYVSEMQAAERAFRDGVTYVPGAAGQVVPPPQYGPRRREVE